MITKLLTSIFRRAAARASADARRQSVIAAIVAATTLKGGIDAPIKARIISGLLKEAGVRHVGVFTTARPNMAIVIAMSGDQVEVFDLDLRPKGRALAGSATIKEIAALTGALRDEGEVPELWPVEAMAFEMPNRGIAFGATVFDICSMSISVGTLP